MLLHSTPEGFKRCCCHKGKCPYGGPSAQTMVRERASASGEARSAAEKNPLPDLPFASTGRGADPAIKAKNEARGLKTPEMTDTVLPRWSRREYNLALEKAPEHLTPAERHAYALFESQTGTYDYALVGSYYATLQLLQGQGEHELFALSGEHALLARDRDARGGAVAWQDEHDPDHVVRDGVIRHEVVGALKKDLDDPSTKAMTNADVVLKRMGDSWDDEGRSQVLAVAHEVAYSDMNMHFEGVERVEEQMRGLPVFLSASQRDKTRLKRWLKAHGDVPEPEPAEKPPAFASLTAEKILALQNLAQEKNVHYRASNRIVNEFVEKAKHLQASEEAGNDEARDGLQAIYEEAFNEMRSMWGSKGGRPKAAK